MRIVFQVWELAGKIQRGEEGGGSVSKIHASLPTNWYQYCCSAQAQLNNNKVIKYIVYSNIIYWHISDNCVEF